MITIICPAFREGERLPRTLSEIEAFISKHPSLISEVVVVDDGSAQQKSGDNTIECAMRYLDRLPLHIECLAVNSGKWAALNQGIRLAKTDAVLLMDADSSASVWELEKLDISGAIQSRTSIFGTRFANDSVVEGKSVFRQVISYGYRLFVQVSYWVVVGRACPVQDVQAPFKLIFKSRQRGGFFAANRFAGDLNFILLYSGPINNLPLYFIHQKGGSIKAGTIVDMFKETVKVVTSLRKEKDIQNILYVPKQQYF